MVEMVSLRDFLAVYDNRIVCYQQELWADRLLEEERRKKRTRYPASIWIAEPNSQKAKSDLHLNWSNGYRIMLDNPQKAYLAIPKILHIIKDNERSGIYPGRLLAKQRRGHVLSDEFVMTPDGLVSLDQMH